METTSESAIFPNSTEPHRTYWDIPTSIFNETHNLANITAPTTSEPAIFLNTTETHPTYWDITTSIFNETFNLNNVTAETTSESAIFANTTEPHPIYWDFTTSIFNETYNQTNGAPPVKNISSFYPILSVVNLISAVCLAFSIAVYAVLPEFKNIHGKNLISMSVCLLMTYIMTLLDWTLRKFLPFPLCLSIAIVMHLNFLAYFFWTNVMAYDIWKSLTDMKTKGEMKASSSKYLKYSVYTWTATLVTATPAAVLDLTDWLPLEDRPGFAVKNCWLNGAKGFINYFELPMGVILLSNLCMFLLTLRKLHAIKKMTAVLNTKHQQKRLNLYLKLFLVMGITWATLFIPWITGVFFLYAVAAMLTGLQGTFLFAIFVCKKRILVNFYYTLRSPKNKKKVSTASNSTSLQNLSNISVRSCRPEKSRTLTVTAPSY